MFRAIVSWFGVILVFCASAVCASAQNDRKTVRVFIFAGQSNMVGSDSKVKDIEKYPPFDGLDKPQKGVHFRYCIGREDKKRSDGWVDLAPVDGVVGPELSFASEVKKYIDAPIAIIKCAAGGTHLGGDWNPDEPQGFKLYPLALDLVREGLADLKRKRIPYRLEGFVWHQGENDMFEEGYRAAYGKNLAKFIARWRRDLEAPELRFQIGELCTKTIWGMDNRTNMYAISLGQKAVAEADPKVDFVPTSHIAVEIGGDGGLHYHYGTLGQLEHGVNHAHSYLTSIGALPERKRPLTKWPFASKSKVRLFVLAGHRNMEGERAFIQDLARLPRASRLAKDEPKVAYRYSMGGGVVTSNGWEPLGPTGPYETFGPELAFADRLFSAKVDGIAIAKFTHSGSQIIDWTPEGSAAEGRNLYPKFIAFIRDAVADLESRGHEVSLEGVFYHLGENDMSYGPYRKAADERLAALVAKSREDLGMAGLRWFVSQQPPTSGKDFDAIDVTAAVAKLAAADGHLIHIKAFDLPEQSEKLVLDAAGIIALGRQLAEVWLARR